MLYDLATVPSGAMRTDLRAAVLESASETPNAIEVSLLVSQRRSKGNSYVSRNFLLAAGESKLIPRTVVFALSKSWIRSRNPMPSLVHPGVLAFGYHQRSMYLPVKSADFTVTSSWLLKVKLGALMPASISAINNSLAIKDLEW